MSSNTEVPGTSREFPLDPEIAIHFRDELRAARGVALKNAEAFEEVIFAIERLGIQLTKKVSGLHEYYEKIAGIADRSALCARCPEGVHRWQTDFRQLYKIVKDARNDALHVGAYARHLTICSIELAIVLEDALMSNSYLVRDYMVKNPIFASVWQPLSLVRQTMLTNSFSYLPVREAPEGRWAWISDFELARCLRSVVSNTQRKDLLALSLGDANRMKKLELEGAATCSPNDTVGEAINKSPGKPVLVLDESSHEVVGIVTPFDVL